jgi:glyoxylase-like metal-dependent hydrolase (beta-lactamase superfamily II)
MNPDPDASVPIAGQRMNQRTRPRVPFVVSWGVAALVGSLSLATVLLSWVNSARAAAPLVRTQAPGFYRLMVGDFEVTVLSDGTVTRPMDQILSKPTEVHDLLRRDHESEEARLSVNAFLINTGAKLLLVDAGAGELFGPSCGKLVANLRASGYAPEQVDAVLLTHIHADHSGGLTVGGQRVFPNALIYVDKREPDYWLDPAQEKAVPVPKRLTFAQSRTALEPYVQADRLRPFDGAGELFPGVRALPAYGHTPGHTAYLVESRGERLLLWGDVIHFAEGQFADPTITVAYDVDPAAAAATRIRLLAEADRDGLLVGSDHISFPGLGHVRAEGANRFAWVPRPYHAEP